MNILLTGSGGFIGKNLKKYLSNRYNILSPRSFEVDFTNARAVKDYFTNNSIDFVIHCGSVGGARGINDSDTTIEDNLSMVDNILSYKRNDVRVILFGSGAMYDKSRNLHKVSESDLGKVIPCDLYGKSKYLIAEKIKNRSDVLMLNIFACYGYGEKESRFPSYAINQVLNNEKILIDQNVIFDYLFVDDMQKIVEYFIENEPEDNIINITPTNSISLVEISNIVNSFVTNPCKIELVNKSMNNEYTGDNTLLLKNYQNCKFTSMEEGLKKLFEYNKGHIKGE